MCAAALRTQGGDLKHFLRQFGIACHHPAEVGRLENLQLARACRRHRCEAAALRQQRHLAEKISVAHFGKRRIVAVSVSDADPDAPILDQIHGVPGFATMEQRHARSDLPHRQQVAQFVGGFVLERPEERHRAEGIYLHRQRVQGLI